MLCLGVVALAPAICAAQQAPAPPDLPAPYHGTPLDKALKAREWPRAEELLVAAIERQVRTLTRLTDHAFHVRRGRHVGACH